MGIGTKSPSYVLHVNGTAYANGAAGALSGPRYKTKGLKYNALIPVLTKAVQELAAENAVLKARIEALEAAL